MTETHLALPGSVTMISLGNKEIYLVGTAHVSKKSVEEVKLVIENVHPDTVCVELCEPRYKAMVEKESWKKMDIFQVIKKGKALFLLGQLLISSFYQRIAEKLGVQPGAEMLEGVRMAEATGATLVLADRPVEITLKRVWRYLSFWSKLKVMNYLLTSFFISEEIDEKFVEELKSQDNLEGIMESFAAAFPTVKEHLIHERDIYLAQKIRNAPGNTIVAIVGAGHVPGIQREIQFETALEPLELIPPKSITSRLIKWAIPLILLALVIIGFFQGGSEQSIRSMYVWVITHGVLSGLGAAVAMAHPLTILASCLAAPFTSLNPMIAAGWVAGLVQAWVKKPTVADLEDIPRAVTSISGFWRNPATRILLIVVLANLGSSLGTLISGSWMAAQIV